MKWFRYPEGGAGGEGGDGATGDSEKIVADLQRQIADMKGMLEDQKKAMGQMIEDSRQSASVLTSPEYLAWVEEQQNGGRSGGASGNDEDVDLTAMSRSELVDYINAQNSKPLTELAKKMDEQMNSFSKALVSLGSRTDVELTKLRNPSFAKTVDTDEGKELFIKIGEENPTWSAAKIWDAMETAQIVAEKKQADLKAAQAEQEKQVWSEKPGAAASIAEEKDLSDDEIAGKAYDAAVGAQGHPLEEEGIGVIRPD